MYNEGYSGGPQLGKWIFCLIMIATICTSSLLNLTIIPRLNASTGTGSNTFCNCVVIRMDDVQDYWLNSVQVALMNLFESKNQSLSLGLIMHYVGNDSKIVNKVNQALSRGLFELDIRGWDHVNYTKMTENDQKNSLAKANLRMQHLFRTKSLVFIPPLDVFNNDTLKAMHALGLRIISSAQYEEKSFNQNRSVFVSNNNLNKTKSTMIYHLPSTSFFKVFDKGKWVKTPLNDIMGNVTRNIKLYGYAVIVIHTQDFARYVNGVFINSVDESQMVDLSRLIDSLTSEGIHIVPFHKVVGI
jgi:peptidoglycan/xylan/chitin deacetylase (PgdA/CDA1 family)